MFYVLSINRSYKIARLTVSISTCVSRLKYKERELIYDQQLTLSWSVDWEDFELIVATLNSLFSGDSWFSIVNSNYLTLNIHCKSPKSSIR